MKTKIKIAGMGLLAVLSVATAAVALDAAATIKARQDFFHSVGKTFKGLNDELKKPAPDIAVIRAATAQLATLAPQLPAQFPAGSGPESGVKTGAKPDIWSNGAEFQKDAAGLKTAADALNQAAIGGNMDAITAATKTAGDACKTCHTTFRSQDH